MGDPRLFFRSSPVVEVEDGDVGSTGQGGEKIEEGPGKAVMDFCGEGRGGFVLLAADGELPPPAE